MPSAQPIQRLPFWLHTEDAALFCCLHQPTNAKGRRSPAVLLCSPLGHEYTHAHRSLRYLADSLAALGHSCLRFDYYGCGNSEGNLNQPVKLSVWRANIAAAQQALKQLSGAERICLLGLRMGATLAADYAERAQVDYLLLWHPCTSGRRYLRELQAINALAPQAPAPETHLLESAGFVLHQDTAAELKQIDLLQLNYAQTGEILLIERDDEQTDNGLLEALQRKHPRCASMRVPGYADMLAEPQDTVIPKKAIDAIGKWVAERSQAATPRNTGPLPHTALLKGSPQTPLHETLCILQGKRSLFGVLCRPQQVSPDRPVILLCNSGSVHHVGPNRLYVELARALAAAGFASLRFDLGNLGDSIQGVGTRNANHPYPEHAVEDVQIAVNALQQQFDFKRYIIAGLCSGAHTAFHAGRQFKEPAFCEAILINPLTFYWQEGMSLDIPNAYGIIKDAKYYQYALKDKAKWLKLLKGRAQTRYIVRFVFDYLRKMVAGLGKALLENLQLRKKSALTQDLLRYATMGRHLSFFFSTTDPGYNILLSEARKLTRRHLRQGRISIEFIQDADHTFSRQQNRRTFIEKLTRHLQQRYSGSST